MDLSSPKVLHAWIFFSFSSKNVQVKKEKKYIVSTHFDILGKLAELFHLQEQVEESKKKYEHMEKDRAEVMAENKRLLEPLREAKEQVDLLKKQLANYEKDKETLRVGFRSLGRLSVYVL